MTTSPHPDHMVNPQAETDRLIAELDAMLAERRKVRDLAERIVTGIVG